MGVYGFVTAVGVGFIAWSSTHMYMYFCAAQGFWGFIQSLVVMDSTFCHILLSLIHHSHSLYGAVMLGVFFTIIGAMSKAIAWMTNAKPEEIPRTVHLRTVTRQPTRDASS